MRIAFVAMETTRQADSAGATRQSKSAGATRQSKSAGARRFERIARLLAERGHEVTVFCGQWWDDYTDEWVVDDLRYRGVTLGTALSSFCARLPAVVGAYNPDVIHARPTPPEQVLSATTASTLARAPLVVEWFGDESLPDHRRTRWAASKPAQVVTPSELVRTHVRELGTPEERTRVIPESIDFDRIETVDPAEEVDVAYAHPLDGSANIQDFLLGLAELREREWSATIIGDGPKRAAYEQEAADLRIDDRVSFVGACDREQRIAVYRGAHAFVQTAYQEQFATELLWALAAGCIGIVEYQAESSAHELIENYDRSFRVTNPQQLADAIVDAGGFEYRDSEDQWAVFDHGSVINDYLDCYRHVRE